MSFRKNLRLEICWEYDVIICCCSSCNFILRAQTKSEQLELLAFCFPFSRSARTVRQPDWRVAASGDPRGEVWRFRLRNARVQRARQTRKVAKPCLATVVVATSEASAGSSPAGGAKRKASSLSYSLFVSLSLVRLEPASTYTQQSVCSFAASTVAAKAATVLIQVVIYGAFSFSPPQPPTRSPERGLRGALAPSPSPEGATILHHCTPFVPYALKLLLQPQVEKYKPLAYCINELHVI